MRDEVAIRNGLVPRRKFATPASPSGDEDGLAATLNELQLPGLSTSLLVRISRIWLSLETTLPQSFQGWINPCD